MILAILFVVANEIGDDTMYLDIYYGSIIYHILCSFRL